MSLPLYDSIGNDANNLLTSDYASTSPVLDLSASTPSFSLPGINYPFTVTETLKQARETGAMTYIAKANVSKPLNTTLQINSKEELTLTLKPDSFAFFTEKKISPEIVVNTNIRAIEGTKLTVSGNLQGESYSSKFSLSHTPSSKATTSDCSLALRLYENFVLGGKVSADSTQLKSLHLLFGLQNPRKWGTDLHLATNYTFSKSPQLETILSVYQKACLCRTELKLNDPQFNLNSPPVSLPLSNVIHEDSHFGAEIKLNGKEFNQNNLSWGLGFKHAFKTNHLQNPITGSFKARYINRGFVGAHLSLSNLPSLVASKKMTLDTSIDFNTQQYLTPMNALSLSAKIAFS
jgi:hypothetical protein